MWAEESYEPQVSTSIDEAWRWTELDILAGFDYFFVDEAANGDLWFADQSGEIARYDGVELERFDVVEGLSVVELHGSPSGDVYVLTLNKFVVLREGEWITLLDESITSMDLYRLAEAEDGSIWVGGYDGFFHFQGDRYDYYETGQVWFRSMVLDRQGMLWLIPENREELYIYDTNNPIEGRMRLVRRIEFPGLSGNRILSLDPQGRVWVLDPDENGDCYFFENYERRLGARGLRGPFFKAAAFRMATLPSGRIWFSVPRGLAELDGQSVRIFSGVTLVPTYLPCLLGLSNERLLIGGQQSKTYIVDLSTDRLATYLGLNYQCKDQDGTEWFLEHDGRLVGRLAEGKEWMAYGVSDGIIERPNCVTTSRDGTLWVSGRHLDSAAVSLRVNGEWRRLSIPNFGDIFSHLGVLESRDGSMVFGSGTPLNRLRGRTGGSVVFRKVKGDWIHEAVVPPNVPRRPAVIVERGDHETWYGSNEMFLGLGGGSLPEVSGTFNPQRWIDDMAVDSANHLWVAAWGGGVFQLKGNEWKFHGEDQGLVSNQVISLLPSDFWSGVWAATPKGLSRFDGRMWSNWELPVEKPFMREGVTLVEGENGTLWVNQAYRDWLLEGEYIAKQRNLFEVRRYRKTDVAPETLMGAFQSELPEGSPVIASWSGRDIWSETPTGELEYSWRIGGGEWSNFSRETDTVLSGIGAGEYLFEVRARDRDWNIDPTPAQAIIYMVPPVWKRAWFITLVIATLALIAFLIERLFRARMRAALALEEFKLDFFTNISHELRNPLAVILGPLESLLQDEHSMNTRQKLRLALRNTRKMQGLVDQLMQFRKVELGKTNYRPAPGELIGFVRETIELHAPLWQERNISVRVRSNVKSCVCAFDSEKLQKIVDNLISNAIKYSFKGGVIEVGVDEVFEDGVRELNFVVEDHGPGIPEHELSLILKPFYRVNGKSNSKGFGIGLALVSGLIKVWGGKMDIESPVDENGRGTRVAVSLPLDEVDMLEPRPELDLVEDLGESEVVSSERAGILLIEDNVDLRTFMRVELSSRYDIIEAGDGLEGLAKAIEENPDLIITDVMMPEMDGFELCRKLREEPETSHVPIIMLTAKSSDEHNVEGVEAGADVYFAKPLNMLKLIPQIENLLDLRRKMKKRFSEQLVVEPTGLTIVPADQEFIRKAISIVESNMDDTEFRVDRFAREMGMGKTTLLKKLRALTGEAPGSFIRSMRLKRAAQLLSKGEMSVSDTLLYVGIHDASYFSRAFKRQFGVAPSQYGKERGPAVVSLTEKS